MQRKALRASPPLARKTIGLHTDVEGGIVGWQHCVEIGRALRSPKPGFSHRISTMLQFTAVHNDAPPN